MAMVAPKYLEDLGEHSSPNEFKAKIHKLLDPILRGYRITGSDLLVATYIPPSITPGGIKLIQKSQQENIFQGKVGLVLQLGPLAFKRDRYNCPWDGLTAKVDDWVMFRFADAWDAYLGGVSIKVLDHESIRAIVDDPTAIY